MKGWQYILQFIGLALLLIFAMATTNGYSPPFNLGDLATNVTGAYNNGGFKIQNTAPGTVAGDVLIFGQDLGFFGSLFASVNNTIQVIAPPSHINGFAVTAAKCDGTTDDTAAINGQIIADGGGTSGFGGHNKVSPIQLPPNQVCNHSKPIEIPFANLDFGGIEGSNITYNNNVDLTQGYIGPAIIAAAYGSTVQTSIAGPFAGTTAYNPFSGGGTVNYDDILNSPEHNLSGLIASNGFHVDGWFYVVSYTAGGGGGEVFGPAITKLGTLNGETQNRSLSFAITNAPNFTISTNLNGSTQTTTLSGGTLPSTGAWHFIRLNETGGTETVYVDGVATGSPITGLSGDSMVQNTFETWCGDGANPTVYPCGGYDNTPPEAYYWGIDIETAAAATPTSVPTGPEAPTSNTLLDIPFDKPADGINHQFQQAYTAGSTLGSPNVYLPWTGTAGNTYIPAYSHIHDIDMCFNQTASCDGLETQWANNSEFDHLTGSAFDEVGINNYEDYISHQHDNAIYGNSPTRVAYVDYGSNESSWDNDTAINVEMLHSFTQSSGSDIHESVQSNGWLIYGTYEQQGHIDWQFFFDDEEATNSDKIAEHVEDQNYGADTWQNSEDALPNNSNDFDFVGGESVGGIAFVPSIYVVTKNSTGTIFHFDSSAYAVPVKYIDVSLDGTIGSMSNGNAIDISAQQQFYANNCPGIKNQTLQDDAAPLRTCMAAMPAGATMNLDGTKEYYFASHTSTWTGIQSGWNGQAGEIALVANQKLNFNGATISQTSSENASGAFVILAGSLQFNTPGSSGGSPTFDAITDVPANATSVTLSTPAHAANYNIGDDIYIDCGSNSGDADIFVGWNQVNDTNSSTGVINLKYPSLKSYGHGNTGCPGSPSAARIYDWTTSGGGTGGANLGPLAHNVYIQGPGTILSSSNSIIDAQGLVNWGIDRITVDDHLGNGQFVFGNNNHLGYITNSKYVSYGCSGDTQFNAGEFTSSFNKIDHDVSTATGDPGTGCGSSTHEIAFGDAEGTESNAYTYDTAEVLIGNSSNGPNLGACWFTGNSWGDTIDHLECSTQGLNGVEDTATSAVGLLAGETGPIKITNSHISVGPANALNLEIPNDTAIGNKLDCINSGACLSNPEYNVILTGNTVNESGCSATTYGIDVTAGGSIINDNRVQGLSGTCTTGIELTGSNAAFSLVGNDISGFTNPSNFSTSGYSDGYVAANPGIANWPVTLSAISCAVDVNATQSTSNNGAICPIRSPNAIAPVIIDSLSIQNPTSISCSTYPVYSVIDNSVAFDP